MKSNSKIVQVGLIVVVIGIWGMIGYRIYNAMGNDVEVLPSMYVPKAIEEEVEMAMTIELDLDYTDPFTGKTPKRKVNKKTMPTTTLDDVETIAKPNIVYKGYSYNDVGERRIAISLDGHLRFISDRERVEDISIVRVEKEKLTISYKGKLFGYQR